MVGPPLEALSGIVSADCSGAVRVLDVHNHLDTEPPPADHRSRPPTAPTRQTSP